MKLRHTVADTVLGPITLVASGDAITGLYCQHHGTRGGLKRKRALLEQEIH